VGRRHRIGQIGVVCQQLLQIKKLRYVGGLEPGSPPTSRRSWFEGWVLLGPVVGVTKPTPLFQPGTGGPPGPPRLVRNFRDPVYRPASSSCASAGVTAPDATSARIWSRVNTGSGADSSPSPSLVNKAAKRSRAVG
jgi:hypothetical protein